MGMACKACGWVTRPNGMVQADSSQWNAGGDSSDQGTLGCPPKGDSSDQCTQGMSRINVIFLTNLENWPISLNIQLLG